MAASRPPSPPMMRLVSASVAAIAALGVVALGVRIGTDGLGSGDAGRTPASGTATPAAAVVDLRARPAGALLEETVISTVEAATPASETAAGGASTSPAPAPAPTDAAPPAPSPAPAPAPTPPAPVPPAPVPPVPVEPPVPVPEPDPVPVLEPVEQLIDGVAGALGL